MSSEHETREALAEAELRDAGWEAAQAAVERRTEMLRKAFGAGPDATFRQMCDAIAIASGSGEWPEPAPRTGNDLRLAEVMRDLEAIVEHAKLDESERGIGEAARYRGLAEHARTFLAEFVVAPVPAPDGDGAGDALILLAVNYDENWGDSDAEMAHLDRLDAAGLIERGRDQTGEGYCAVTRAGEQVIRAALSNLAASDGDGGERVALADDALIEAAARWAKARAVEVGYDEQEAGEACEDFGGTVRSMLASFRTEIADAADPEVGDYGVVNPGTVPAPASAAEPEGGR